MREEENGVGGGANVRGRDGEVKKGVERYGGRRHQLTWIVDVVRSQLAEEYYH